MENGIPIEFPDLPGCLPCAGTPDEAARNAKEAMGLHLWGMEKDNDPIPEPTGIAGLKHPGSGMLLLVEVFMPPVRDRFNNIFFKRRYLYPNG